MAAVAVLDAQASVRAFGVPLSTNADRIKRMGAALKTLREDRLGLTQYAVAERMGLTVDAYRHYEAGRRRITADQLPDLAAALGISLDGLSRLLFEDEGVAGTVAVPDDLAARIEAMVRELHGEQKARTFASILRHVIPLSPADAEEYLRFHERVSFGYSVAPPADRHN